MLTLFITLIFVFWAFVLASVFSPALVFWWSSLFFVFVLCFCCCLSACVGCLVLGDKREVRFWNVAVPRSLDEALEAAVGRVWHRTKTEFIREAVRRELERLGFKPSVDAESQGQC